jgi:hypothetical protein
VFAFNHLHTPVASSTATFSFSGGSLTFTPIGAGSLAYNNNTDYEFGAWVTGNGSTGSFTVTFSDTTDRAYLMAVELCGNDTSDPIAQSAYASSGADATQSHPYTANLPLAPLQSTNYDVYFLNTHEDLGGGIPTSTPAATDMSVGHNGAPNSGSAYAYRAGTPSQNESFDHNPAPTDNHWGTIAVEIKRP